LKAHFLMKNFTPTAALCCALALSFTACKTITDLPVGTHLAENFNPAKFEGSWYQIARVPNKAEAGITSVKTSFLQQPDGRWQVSDLGWKNEYGRWVSRTKVSLNRPETPPGTFLFRFNEPRHVLAVDPTFKHAIVSGSNLKLLWILSLPKRQLTGSQASRRRSWIPRGSQRPGSRSQPRRSPSTR
jgi:apolipoprotein D and lipocalin family protein